VSSGAPDEARALGWQLLQQRQDAEGSPAWYRSAVLAGAIAEELGGAAETNDQAIHAEVVRRLVVLVQGGHLPSRERVEAAFLLARLGDPRLPRPEQPDYWCPIDAGPFWLGDETREALEQMTLATAYRIGRFPVTNAEYRAFIEAGGADLSQDWWTEEGRAWHESEERTEPALWQDETQNSPHQPVVGVTWYEAVAYCAWRTAQGHDAGWLPAEAIIRLPTYAEWVRAARQTDQRRYPWGDADPDPERANYQATGLSSPSPVGCFPRGAAQCGAQDLAGNIWEWTASLWKQPRQQEPLTDQRWKAKLIVLSGSFAEGSDELSCGARRWYFPIWWNGDVGFRLVWLQRHPPEHDKPGHEPAA
jgi:formylglycine-generating enzyme required for sulfatase activity